MEWTECVEIFLSCVQEECCRFLLVVLLECFPLVTTLPSPQKGRATLHKF